MLWINWDSCKQALVLEGILALDIQERDARRLWDLEQSEHLQTETMQEFRMLGSFTSLEAEYSDSDEEVARLESGRGKLTVEGLGFGHMSLGSCTMPNVKEPHKQSHTELRVAGE